MKISICIPTFNRSDVLKEAILSCLNQTHLPYEILIGDDSSNTETEKLIEKNFASSQVNIRYFRNQPSLKQAENVNSLFKMAEGELTVLLHDDDLLTTNSLKCLYNCFVNEPSIDVAFGKQYIISDKGDVNIQASLKLNDTFYRTAAYEGMRLTPLEAGFLQQFPNDGYMIKSEVAKQTMYRSDAKDACDFDFGLRIGINNYKIYFLNEYTTKYRLSDKAVSTNPDYNAGLISYLLVERLVVPTDSLKYKSKWLKDKSPVALMQAINLKNKKKSLEIYLSKWHRGKILTLGGIKRLFLILSL